MDEQSQKITQQDVSAVLKAVRAFYKGKEKSGNKMYANPTTDEQKRRNQNAEAVDEQGIPALRAATSGMSPAEKGEYIRFYKQTYGNCSEMSAVAARFCLASPELMANAK
jgi:hypothetical protein